MLARTTTTTFLMPFPIGNTRRELPAASYVVEADEELLHTLSLLAHRRVATILRAPRLRGSSDLLDAVSIGAAELETALTRDVRRFNEHETEEPFDGRNER